MVNIETDNQSAHVYIQRLATANEEDQFHPTSLAFISRLYIYMPAEVETGHFYFNENCCLVLGSVGMYIQGDAVDGRHGIVAGVCGA